MDSNSNYEIVVVVVSSAIGLYFAYRMAIEAKKTREMNLQAQIIAYFTNTESNASLVKLVFQNVGSGTAYNVKARMINGLDYTGLRIIPRPITERGVFINPISYFPPKYEIQYILLSLADGYELMINQYLEFEVIYDDDLKKGNSRIIRLHLTDVEGRSVVTPPDNYVGLISYRLEKIEKLIEKKIRLDSKSDVDDSVPS